MCLAPFVKRSVRESRKIYDTLLHLSREFKSRENFFKPSDFMCWSVDGRFEVWEIEVVCSLRIAQCFLLI